MCNDPNLHPRIRGGYMIIIVVTNTPLLYPPKNIISKKIIWDFPSSDPQKPVLVHNKPTSWILPHTSWRYPLHVIDSGILFVSLLEP